MSDTSLLQEVGLNRLLRYGYGGLLLMLLAAYINPDGTAKVVGALGLVLAPLAALGLGAGIYVIHRHVIGERFLYLILHSLTQRKDRRKGRADGDVTDTVAYLRYLGVEPEDCRAAYNEARRGDFFKDAKERLDVAHSELHMLWITVDEAIIASSYLLAHRVWLRAIVIGLIGLVVAACAAYADIRQHQSETHMLKLAEKQGKQVTSFLQQNGYLKADQVGGAS